MRTKLIALFIMIAGIVAASACEVAFDVEGGQKKSYKAGDELIINVKVTLTHRVCKVGAKDTKFKFEGIKITGASDWKEPTPGVYTRQVKATVTPDGSKIMLSVIRTCEKEGVNGILTLVKE